MVRDDLLIGSLRIPIRELQEMVSYLESRRDLSGEDIVYCRHKVTELMRQLKALQRIVDLELRRSEVQEPLCWN
jgi:uncharacterized protein YPO0396